MAKDLQVSPSRIPHIWKFRLIKERKGKKRLAPSSSKSKDIGQQLKYRQAINTAFSLAELRSGDGVHIQFKVLKDTPTEYVPSNTIPAELSREPHFTTVASLETPRKPVTRADIRVATALEQQIHNNAKMGEVSIAAWRENVAELNELLEGVKAVQVNLLEQRKELKARKGHVAEREKVEKGIIDIKVEYDRLKAEIESAKLSLKQNEEKYFHFYRQLGAFMWR
ncbi:hypothetical protein BJ508DRAFT_326672 [Ascobolus immersus RN42]|uniref:Uncharacterized protein n=1 Tax=Ascobolus immersus RN42 TaxID=1160509 RepID=A0A3N4I5B7_ASCIM|nr:hypothetical protein BJ508DRAFT_326672 [Ascobolus immersus RN42]